MKRGFKQLFSQERTVRNADENDVDGIETERKRPARFFQKFFRSSGSLSSSPAGSPRTFRRINNTDEDEYAEIKREMSVPISPKSVKFEDEIPVRRGQSAMPQTSAFTSRTMTQQRTVSHQQKSRTADASPFSWRSDLMNGELDTAQSSQYSATSREVSGLRASHSALDEATRELLQLSALPASAASISYSSTPKLTPAADQLQKSASTSSMNKVIRTIEGGVLKLSNVFTWDAARLGESPHQRSLSPIERTFTNGDGNARKTVLVYKDADRRGAPAVRTSVEGKLQMEKIVGADLANIEHCVSSGWTIKDTVTHYKVKTRMGERTLVMEERQLPNGEEPANDFKMSVYEGDTLKSEQQAEIRIPPNMDDDVRDGSTTAAHDEIVIPRRIYMRVSEDTQVNLNENIDDAGENRPMNGTTHDANMYSENLAEIYYLITVRRSEETANCNVVIMVAPKCWTSFPVQCSARIYAGHRSLEIGSAASSSLTDTLGEIQQVPERYEEAVKPIAFVQTDENTSEQVTIIRVVPIVLDEKRGELQKQRTNAFEDDQEINLHSTFQFRNVPIAYSKAEVTGVNKVTSALFDKPALGTLADSSGIGVANDFCGTRPKIPSGNEYQTEYESEYKRESSVRGGTENSIWHGDTERGRAQISTSTMSENTSSAGSTTGASFEQLDISQDDRSHLVAVSDLSNACRQDGDVSTYEQISRSSTIHGARSASSECHLRHSLNLESTEERHPAADRVFNIPIGREVAVERTCSRSRTDSDKTLTEEQNANETLGITKHGSIYSRAGWISELSAARIAMMQAGVDLETVLLSTPASGFMESSMRREFYNARQYLNTCRSISESDFTSGDLNWEKTGFYRSFEYHHHWSSERDIRTVDVEESRSRPLRSSSAEMLKRLVRTSDRMEDSIYVEQPVASGVHQTDVANLTYQQNGGEKFHGHRIVAKGEKSDRKEWSDERTIQKDQGERRLRTMKSEEHSFGTAKERSTEVNQRTESSDLKNLLYRSEHKMPPIHSFSNVASQTESAFKKFDYITTIDTVLHSDQKAEEMSQRSYADETPTYKRLSTESLLERTSASIKKDKSATAVTFISPSTVCASTSEGVLFHTSLSSHVETGDKATQTVLPLEFTETSGIGRQEHHLVPMERIRPILLSTRFAQTDDMLESVVQRPFQDIHPTHNIIQNSAIEQMTTNERQQLEEFSHTHTIFDTNTRVTSLRDTKLTAELISARGPMLETVDSSQYVKRKEEFADADKLQAMKLISHESRKFSIEEQRSESTPAKMNADAAAYDIIMQTAAQDKARGEFVEYVDRRPSTLASFQRMERATEKEFTSTNVADAVILQASLNASASSSEHVVGQLKVDRPQEDRNVLRTLKEENIAAESRSISATTESSATLEKAFDVRAEFISAGVTFEDKDNIRVSTTHKEFGDEKQVLDANWSTVVREASAEKYLPMRMTDRRSLETSASSEQTATCDTKSEKIEERFFAEQVRPLCAESSTERNWKVSAQEIENLMKKLPVDEFTEKSVSEKQHAEIWQQFFELDEVQSTTGGTFTRLERTQQAATAEEKVALQRKLAISFETMPAQEETTVEQLQLEKERLRQLETEAKISERSADIIFSSVHAAIESNVSETVSFSGRLERKFAHGSVLPERKVEKASIMTAESRIEEQNYIGGWDTVIREMSTESNIIDVLELTETLTTSASEENTVQVLSEVQKQPHTDFAVEIHPVREKCTDSRGFEINEENQEAAFKRTQASASCEYVALDRWRQRDESTFNEFGSVDAEAIGFFNRIALSKHDSEKVEVVKTLARVWHECFEADESKEEECNNDIHLTLDDKAALGSLLVKSANRAYAYLSTDASRIVVISYNTELKGHTAEWRATFTVSSKSHENVVSLLLEPVSITGKFLDAVYTTILNDEEIEISVDDTFKAHAVLSTEASKLNEVQTAGRLVMESLEQSVVFSVPVTQFTAGENRFGISEERCEKLVERAQAKSGAENVFKDIVHGDSVSRLLTESGEAEANTGVLLMRRAACRKSASASHVIDISATLTQHLDTQSAKEAFNDISLYFSLPTSETEVQNTITLTTVENVVLAAEHAKEEITARSVGFTRAKDERREAESVLKASSREHAKKQMKESASNAFEVLSELTTVYRDLEAEAAFRQALNVKRVVTILATTEENADLSEEWSAREATMEAEHSLPELAFNTCERCFAIESDWLRITLEKFAQSDGALKLRKDARREVLSSKMRESGHEKLNAVINLCKVSNVCLLRNTSECVWADRLTISAEPIRLICEAAATDIVTVENCLQRLPSQYSVRCERISAVTTQPISFECEQAGDEKTKMLIDIRGQQITYDAAGKVWPLPNHGERVGLETEEYCEDKCALFAQLNSRRDTFADCVLYLAICNNHRPITFITKASHEEAVTFTDHWQVAPQLKQLTHILLIGNRSENLIAKVNEPQEHLRTIVVQYSREEHLLSTECRNVEARFGGEYALITKASQEECRNMSLGLSRRSQVETLRARPTQKLRLLSSLCLHASTSESTSLEAAFSKVASPEETTAQKACQRTIEPISGRFSESAEITHVIHAHFRTRESHFLLPVIVKLANFGGHFSLHTDYAEESIFNGEYSFRKDECFTKTSGVMQGSNKAADVILQTACAKESSTVCAESWSRGDKYEETAIIRKQANTSQPLTANVKESMDIKQSTYLQYSKEPQELSLEKTVDEAVFGGRFCINTDASEEHEQNVCREVEADRQFVMHADKLVVERVTMMKEMTLKATSLITAELTRHLTRDLGERAVATILRGKNRDRCQYSVREAEEEELTANAYYSKDSQQLISSRIVQLARDGGSFVLLTKASAYEEHILDILLKKDRLHESFTSYTVIIVNSESSILLETKQSESEVNSVSEHLHRKEQKDDTSTLRRATNRGEPVSHRLKEMSECEEITHCHYKRATFSVNVEHMTWEKRYGGSHLLHTMASTDYTLATTANLCSRRSSVDGTKIIVTIANRLKEATFNAMSTTEERIELSCSFSKQPSLTTVAQIRKTPNTEAIRCSVVESMQVDEIINIQLESIEETQSKVAVLADKRFGGSIVLSTDFAQECECSMMGSLFASPSEVTAFASITLSLVNTTEHPLLSTAYSSEHTASCSFQLTKTSQVHRADVKRLTPNKGECIVVSMNECTSVQSNTQLNYTKNAHIAHISEVIAESRYGGSIRLDTFSSEYKELQHDMTMMASRIELISAETCFIEKNAALPVYLHASAATEETAATIAQLQKSSVFYGASQILFTSRKGERQEFRLKESMESDEYISVQMRREEFGEDVEVALNEGRFGGRIQLQTSHAEECSASVIEKLAKEQVTAEVSAIMRAVNEAQPTVESCRASEEVEVLAAFQLECGKAKTAEVSVLRSTSNKASPVCLQTGETVESLLTINVSMHRPMDEKTANYISSEKRYGGGECLACAAASEQHTKETVLRFQKSSELARSSFVVCTANKTMELLQTNASTETVIVVPVSILSRCEQKASVSAYCALALFGGCLSAKFMAAEETIFNADVSYEKQHSEAQFTLLRSVIREESPKLLKTAASQTQETEVTGTEVRRRLTEVHVESAIERAAREITPVSLQTDYARETMIRTDEELSSLQHRHIAEVYSEQSVAITESDRIVCTTPVKVELRHEEEFREGLKEEKSEKRVSFAAEVTEKTLSMDMSMTVERREAPSIIKKPMKRESRGRRSALKQNEAPNFVPMRRNSLLMALAMGSPHNIPHFRTLEDVIKGIKRAGLEYSNLIFGIDYTRSNYYQGEKTFDGRNLHDLSPDEMNPYQQVIEILGKTLSSFDADGVIPAYGFGDEETTDQSIFNLYDKDDLDAECNGFEEVLRIYNEKTPFMNMSGPTNFVPLIEKAVQIVRTKQSYHILVIVADGQVTNEKINQKAIAAASHYPLSIIMVGVGDGPWNMMTRFDETLPKRMFDNFHFVDFHKVMYNAPNQEASFALNALMEIPDQYKAIKELGLLKHNRRG
uniref:VWFA domain-containing protein n=2 Tax=Parascaris TaxID=6254 RepID=A0A915A4T4_PARUN